MPSLLSKAEVLLKQQLLDIIQIFGSHPTIVSSLNIRKITQPPSHDGMYQIVLNLIAQHTAQSRWPVPQRPDGNNVVIGKSLQIKQPTCRTRKPGKKTLQVSYRLPIMNIQLTLLAIASPDRLEIHLRVMLSDGSSKTFHHSHHAFLDDINCNCFHSQISFCAIAIRQ